jgi:hypothetical protein
MDILLILVGAIIAILGFIAIGGMFGMAIASIGFVLFVIGLILNHRRHQGRGK